jgi:hypothetical protein
MHQNGPRILDRQTLTAGIKFEYEFSTNKIWRKYRSICGNNNVPLTNI